MMLGYLIKLGDKVVINIEKESRDWGYSPCPDGTKAKVIGFSEIHYGRTVNFGKEPGVYPNTSWVKLRMPDGTEHTEWDGRLTLIDNKEYKRRLDESKKVPYNQRVNRQKIRDLPDTPFWEGDFVTGYELTSRNIDPAVVNRIDFQYLDKKRDDGSPFPIYVISDKMNGGWTMSFNDEELSLVARGQIWKYYHNVPFSFVDLKEEAEFFKMLGKYDEVPSPVTNLYKWTKDEVLEAIQNGICDGFFMSNGLFGFSDKDESRISAVRFHDRDLGKRIAAKTLEGFDLLAVVEK